MTHKAFFGDKERVFALTPELMIELERKTGTAIAVLYSRVLRAQFHFNDLIEIIRLGLIGGGTTPSEAQSLVDTYAKPRPIMETFPLAADILDARWTGTPVSESNAQDETGHVAAIDDALNQVAP